MALSVRAGLGIQAELLYCDREDVLCGSPSPSANPGPASQDES
jgi:hypothetical protein